MCVCVFVYLCLGAFICVSVCVYVCLYLGAFMCASVCLCLCACVFFCLSVCFCVCLFMPKLKFKGGRGHSLGQCAAFKKNNFVYSVETFGFSRFAFVLRSRRVERLKSREKVQVIKNWSNTKKWSRRQNTFLWLSQVENGNKFWRLFKALRSNKDVHTT